MTLSPEEFEVRAQAAWETLSEKARPLGLYAEGMQIAQAPDSPDMIVVAHFSIGDVAFAPRVQDPAKDSTDRSIREMEASMQSNEFRRQRERIERRLAEGRDVLDSDDDEDVWG